MQEATRDVLIQAGDGNFVPTAQQVGQQVGSTVVGAMIGAGAGKAATVLKGRNTSAPSYMYDAMNPGPLPDGVAGTFAGGRYSVGTVQAYYAITSKAGIAPNVLVSEVAGTSQETVTLPGGAQQVIVPNRGQWTEPVKINPFKLR